jgi:hypothetical protein
MRHHHRVDRPADVTRYGTVGDAEGETTIVGENADCE